MRLVPLGVAAIVVGFASVARAQDAGVLGRDDVEFSESLLERGYRDLADGLTRVIERQDEAYFRRAEGDVLRLDSLDPEIEPQSEKRAIFIRARTLQLHASTLERGSDRRVRLCDQALADFETADLDWFGEAPLWIYRAYVYCGLCWKEMGKTKEAVEYFDRVIALRRSYGDADAQTDVYPIPRDARDVVDLVCDAVFQKMLVLRDAKKLDEAVAAGKDYLATIPKPFEASSAMQLAQTLCAAQLTIGDAKGAVETARRMFREDPDRIDEREPRESPDSDAATSCRNVAEYYWKSVEPQVDGSVAKRLDDMRAVADRLFVCGLCFNRVPAWRVGFADWSPERKVVSDCWVKAAAIYKSALATEFDERTAIHLGRTYGFLRQWSDAARVYAALFDQEPILTPDKRKLDLDAVKAKQELTRAYLEWGVAEQMAAGDAKRDEDKQDRLNRCISTILMPMNFTLKAGTNPELFWGAMYHLVRALMDKGLYTDAKLKIDDLMRSVSPTFDDGKFGYQKLFDDTLKELR